LVNWGGRTARRACSRIRRMGSPYGRPGTPCPSDADRSPAPVPVLTWHGFPDGRRRPADRSGDPAPAREPVRLPGCPPGVHLGCRLGVCSVYVPLFRLLRCMVALRLRLRRRCHYKSRPTRVNPDSRLHVTNVGELRLKRTEWERGQHQACRWCCLWGVGAYVWCCRYRWQDRETGS
jgi:hypothetical protein